MMLLHLTLLCVTFLSGFFYFRAKNLKLKNVLGVMFLGGLYFETLMVLLPNLLHRFPSLQEKVVFSFHLFVLSLTLASAMLSLVQGVLYLLQQQALKQKKQFWNGLSLEHADRNAFVLIVCGFVFLTWALISGVVLAHLYWQARWYVEQKFIFSMLTWVWYLGLIVSRLTLGLKGKRFLMVMVFGYGLLMLVFMMSLLR